jgi:hypothetical protein
VIDAVDREVTVAGDEDQRSVQVAAVRGVHGGEIRGVLVVGHGAILLPR